VSGSAWFEDSVIVPGASGVSGPVGELSDAIKLSLSSLFLGDSEIDQVTGTSLVAVGTTPARKNQPTDALIEAEPTPTFASTAFDFPVADDSWEVLDGSFNNVTTGSSMLGITFQLNSTPADRALVGKFEIAPDVVGIELKVTAAGLVQCAVRFLGEGATQTVQLSGTFFTGIKHTVVCLIDHSLDLLVLGSTDEGATESDNEASVAIPASGTLTNLTTKWAIGAQRLQAFDGQVLTVWTADGTQVEGRSPKLIAREAAKLTWWDDQRGRITP
jgi:hypothetical protein